MEEPWTRCFPKNRQCPQNSPLNDVLAPPPFWNTHCPHPQQIRNLNRKNIGFDVVFGLSSFSSASECLAKFKLYTSRPWVIDDRSKLFVLRFGRYSSGRSPIVRQSELIDRGRGWYVLAAFSLLTRRFVGVCVYKECGNGRGDTRASPLFGQTMWGHVVGTWLDRVPDGHLRDFAAHQSWAAKTNSKSTKNIFC